MNETIISKAALNLKPIIKSDVDPDSWLTTNMIKLFQSKKEQDLANLPELKSGSVFGVVVDFESKEYPILSLISYPFDFS